jgi:hypothetical protein
MPALEITSGNLGVANSLIDMEKNTFTNVNNQNNGTNGVIFSNDSGSTTTLRLVGNLCTTSSTTPTVAFFLRNLTAADVFSVQSSNGALSGVASLNQGTTVGPDTPTKVGPIEITNVGTTTFIPLNPLSP